MNDSHQLRELLESIYERRIDEVRVSPAWLATEALLSLDPRKTAPTLVYRAAHLQLRQLARGLCRQRFEDDGEWTEQHDLFPNLQKRYPAVHTTEGEPEYVLLEHLTALDIAFNLNRLRREANAKLSHADALEAWSKQRSTPDSEAAA